MLIVKRNTTHTERAYMKVVIAYLACNNPMIAKRLSSLTQRIEIKMNICRKWPTHSVLIKYQYPKSRHRDRPHRPLGRTSPGPQRHAMPYQWHRNRRTPLYEPGIPKLSGTYPERPPRAHNHGGRYRVMSNSSSEDLDFGDQLTQPFYGNDLSDDEVTPPLALTSTCRGLTRGSHCIARFQDNGDEVIE